MGSAKMEEGRGAPAADVAPELVLGGAAEVALHGDVWLRGRLPFEHPVCKGALDGTGWDVVRFQQFVENRTIGAKEMSSTAGEVGGGGGGVVSRVQTQLRLHEHAAAVVQNEGVREEVGQGHCPGGGGSGPAGCQLMGFPIEDRQEVSGVAVMLCWDPQLSMGAETEEGGGEAAPQ